MFEKKIEELRNYMITNRTISSINKLDSYLSDYSFYYFSSKNSFVENQEICQNKKNSSIIIIDNYQDINHKTDELHFIIGFKKTIIIITDKIISTFFQWLSRNDHEVEISK